MLGYPFLRRCVCFLVVILSSNSMDSVVNVRFSKVSIFADRTSPALSAIQDALTLKDLEFELNQKKDLLNTNKNKEVDKVSLKGMKISLKESRGNISPVKKFALRGEAIDVKHFSDKFINLENKKPRTNLITISTPDSKPLKLAAAQEPGFLKEKVLSNGKVLRIEKDEKESGMAASQATSSQGGVFVVRSPIKLSGSLSLKGGSFTRSDSFVYHIGRKFKDKTYESMSLRGDQRNYEIELLDRKGFLTVELRDPAGEILAYGEENLPKNGQNLLNLVLEPSAGLFSGQSLETKNLQVEESFQVEQVVPGSKTFVAGVEGSLISDQKGFFGETTMFSKNSEFLSSTVKKNYWPTLSLTEAGKAHYPRLVKRSVIDRLEADLDPFGEAVKIESLLLGKVTHRGLNRSGVQVEIFGQTYQKPIYFSVQGRPDPSLNKTSTHGGFVFTNLPDGGYLVQVLKNNTLLSQKWFVVRSGHISRGQIDLRARSEKLIFLESFPAYVKDNRSLKVRELGMEEPMGVNSLSAELTGFELDSKTTPSVTVLEISEGRRRGLRQFTILPSKASDISLKRVSTTWLDSYLNRQRSNRNLNLGLIVGFVDDNNFELVKESIESLTEKSEIFYFDKVGNPTPKGVKGGGFVITNTRLGFQPLIIKLENEQRFLNKVVFTSSNSISVF